MTTYWMHPRYVFEQLEYKLRKAYGFFHRGWHGWAPHDTWNFDHHIARVVVGGLQHMAKQSHGVPSFIYERCGVDFIDSTKEQHEVARTAWNAWLEDKARWFQWYIDEEIGIHQGMTDEEKQHALDFYDRQWTQFHEVVLPDFWEHFPALWD